MFVQRKKKKIGDKVLNHSVALLHNYREDGKIKHKTILNLSSWTPEQVDALDSALKGKSGLSIDDIQVSSGLSFGSLFVLKQIAKDLGIINAIGNSKYLNLVLLLVFARIITQGSRRHILNWSETQSISSVLGIESFSLDSLYDTLDWLSLNQDSIEDKLFDCRGNTASNLFLYDVTSSYLEGECNELADYGYNRDKKQGKKQIVIGLLCNGSSKVNMHRNIV